MLEETELEREIRQIGKYPEIEAELPVLRSRKESGIIDRISAFLGERNPLAKPVDPHEHLEKVGDIMSIVDKVVIVKGVPSSIANRGSET